MRAEIAKMLGVSHDTGSFRNNLTKLRTLKLMRDVDRQTLQAAAWLFPPDLPE